MSAGDCLLPSTCNSKCAEAYLPFFEGDCFEHVVGRMDAATQAQHLAFGQLCAAANRCPRAELAGRLAEVNAACAIGGGQHRRAQAGAALGALPAECGPDCAPLFTEFFVDCFETGRLKSAPGSADFFVKCARLQQTPAARRTGASCGVQTDCRPDDDGLMFALDGACPDSFTDTRWDSVAEPDRSDESLAAALDSKGCYHDCGDDASGNSMDRVCDDTSFTQVATVDECRAACVNGGFNFMGLTCPMAPVSWLTNHSAPVVGCSASPARPRGATGAAMAMCPWARSYAYTTPECEEM